MKENPVGKDKKKIKYSSPRLESLGIPQADMPAGATQCLGGTSPVACRTGSCAKTTCASGPSVSACCTGQSNSVCNSGNYAGSTCRPGSSAGGCSTGSYASTCNTGNNASSCSTGNTASYCSTGSGVPSACSMGSMA